MAAEQTIHLDRYAPDAKTLVASAQSLADERKHAQVEPVHLLARAIEDGIITPREVATYTSQASRPD